jgi:hypothetical protein
MFHFSFSPIILSPWHTLSSDSLASCLSLQSSEFARWYKTRKGYPPSSMQIPFSLLGNKTMVMNVLNDPSLASSLDPADLFFLGWTLPHLLCDDDKSTRQALVSQFVTNQTQENVLIFLSCVLSSCALRLVGTIIKEVSGSGAAEGVIFFNETLQELLRKIPSTEERDWNSVFVKYIQRELEQVPFPKQVIHEIGTFVGGHVLRPVDMFQGTKGRH